MCMIIVNDTAVPVDVELLADIAASNAHGAGLYRIESDTLEYFHESSSAPLEWLANPDEPYIVHFRFVTAGGRAPKNLHPHPIPNTRSVLFHNGTISALVSTGKATYKCASDSRRMAALLSRADPDTWFDILDIAGPSRFVLVDRDAGTFTLHGPTESAQRDGWIEHDGVSYSKDPYLHCVGHAWTGSLGGWDRYGMDDTAKYDAGFAAKAANDTPDDVFDPDAESQYPVFVYGTLMQGCGNDALLKHAELIGEAETVAPHILDVSGAFPYLHRAPDGGRVRGELYYVTHGELDTLDALEGVPHHYTRDRVTVALDGADTAIVAEAYYSTDALRPYALRGLSWRDAVTEKADAFYRRPSPLDAEPARCGECLAIIDADREACPSCGVPTGEDTLLIQGA